MSCQSQFPPFIDWKGLRLQWSRALHDVPIGQFNQPCVWSKEEEHFFFGCCTYSSISSGSLSRSGEKGVALYFRTLGWQIYSNDVLWLYLHLDEHAAAYPFETLGGNNILERERDSKRERQREPIQTTKECSPSLSAAALHPPVVGCVIAPQLKCLCLWRARVCVGVRVWVCVTGIPWWPRSAMSTAQPISNKWLEKKDSIREEFLVLACR